MRHGAQPRRSFAALRMTGSAYLRARLGYDSARLGYDSARLGYDSARLEYDSFRHKLANCKQTLS